jgi:hypothetical protein
MLLHQFILIVVATAKRFESVLLTIPAALRRAVSRFGSGGSDPQDNVAAASTRNESWAGD